MGLHIQVVMWTRAEGGWSKRTPKDTQESRREHEDAGQGGVSTGGIQDVLRREWTGWMWKGAELGLGPEARRQEVPSPNRLGVPGWEAGAETCSFSL